MKIILAPDSFKGTLSSIEIIDILEEVAKKHFDNLEVIKVPIADGGEGTVESLITALGGEYKSVNVTGPLGNKVTAKYGILNKNTAVIEMSQASGITLVNDDEKDPLIATTYGTGELIIDALNNGMTQLIIGIGGSATNDGGIGALQALELRFLDNTGNNVGFGGGNLSNIVSIDESNLDKRISSCNITVICDVKNPLTGENGATYIYGPQKGATKEKLVTLEAGMENYASLIKKYKNIDINTIQGSGAAGGLGAAFVAFLGGKLKPGIETILDFIDFDKIISEVDFVVTGEGKMDSQTVNGKAPVGIASRCMEKNIPVVAIVGAIGENSEDVYNFGIDSIMSVYTKEMTFEEIKNNPKIFLTNAADRMFRFIKVGMKIK